MIAVDSPILECFPLSSQSVHLCFAVCSDAGPESAPEMGFNSEDPPANSWSTGEIAISAIMSLLFILIVLANGFILFVMARDSHIRQQRAIVLLVNIAAADLGVGLFLGPIQLWNWHAQRFDGGLVMCAWYACAALFWCQVSTAGLAVIAVERYLLVVKRIVLEPRTLFWMVRPSVPFLRRCSISP